MPVTSPVPKTVIINVNGNKKRRATGTHTTGWCCAPVDKQFQLGGKPGPGRPRGSKSQDTLMREELNAKQPVRVGADIIIIDDAMKAEDMSSEAKRAELDRFYRQTLLTRLNSKRRGIVISIQQRLGEDDMPARLLAAGADHLFLPSYDDCERVFEKGFGRQYPVVQSWDTAVSEQPGAAFSVCITAGFCDGRWHVIE